MNPSKVREQYKKIRPLANLSVTKRGWTLDVLKSVHRIGRQQFSLQDVYQFEGDLAALHPKNRNVRPKIRQQLQVLRDLRLERISRRCLTVAAVPEVIGAFVGGEGVEGSAQE